MSTAELAASTPQVPALKQRIVKVLKNLVPIAMAVAIWFFPVPEGLTPQAWHLFAIFITAIVSVLLGLYPLLTSTMLAAGRWCSLTQSPRQSFRRLRQFQRVAGGDCLSGCPGGGEVRAWAPHQPLHGEPVRTFFHGARLQHCHHRCGNRSSLPQQYLSRRSALSDRALRRPGIGLSPRRSPGPPVGRRI